MKIQRSGQQEIKAKIDPLFNTRTHQPKIQATAVIEMRPTIMWLPFEPHE